MPLRIVRNDITKMKVDAIVNAANRTLLGGGGVDGCIHRAAGPALLAECRALGGCGTGDAKITGAGNLPCKYVIHTVGPVWRGGGYGEREKLRSCYSSSLRLALEYGCGSVAFPLISSGVYGYPVDKALQVASEAIIEFLAENDMTVFIVIFDRNSYRISAKLFSDIKEYMDGRCSDDRTAEELAGPEGRARAGKGLGPACEQAEASLVSREEGGDPADAPENREESFSEMLMRKIAESGMTDAQCYKRANIDRRLFYKIRGDRLFRPGKPIAVALAAALRLSPAEMRDMLGKAGFSLSRASRFDTIVEFFFERGGYDVFEINEALFAFGQALLGS